jgi:hypothetical protein
MANDLPPGFELDEPASGLPPGFELDDGPKSGGAFAAKELAPGQDVQGERRRKLMQLLEAKGEPGYGARLADNFTMGLNRPLGGVASVLGGGSWKAGVGAEEDYIKRAEANTNPVAGAAVDILGGVASGGPVKQLVKGAAQVPSRAAKVAQWLMGSTGSGAIEGAARNSEDLGSAATGAVVGGATSKASSSVVGALTDRLAGKAAREAVAEVTERGGGSKALKEAGGEIFDRLDNAGIHFSGKETPKLANNVNAVTSGPLPASVRGEIDEVVQDVNRRVQNGAMTYGDVRAVQSDISKLKANANPDVRRVAGEMSDAVDDFFHAAKPTMPAASVGKIGPNDLTEAKDLWHRGSKAAKAEYLAEKGTPVASDTAKKVRQNFSSEVDKVKDPDRFSRFQSNPKEVAALEDIARGDPKTSATAALLDKYGNQLLGYGSAGLATGLGSAAAFGDPIGVGSGLSGAGTVAMLLGAGAKGGSKMASRIAANRGSERVNSLIRNIVGDDAPAVPRDALAKILAAEQIKRGAGRYSSNFFDKE